jgi:hypothetical protein
VLACDRDGVVEVLAGHDLGDAQARAATGRLDEHGIAHRLD